MTDVLERGDERDEIIRLARELLLGPREQGETIRSAPADTYLTGILWPVGEPLGSMEDEQNDGVPVNEDGETDAAVPGYRTVRPCSIGLTFAATADAAVVISLASTARYVREKREPPEGRPSEPYWRRVPLGYSYEMPAGGAEDWSPPEFRGADGSPVRDPEVRLHIRRRIDGDRQVVTVTLVNEADERDDRHRDECCLFQTGLEVRAVDRGGAGALRPRPAALSASDDEDAQSAALLYRDVVEYAVGHGVAAEWKSAPASGVDQVATTWLPAAKVKGTSPEAHAMLNGLLKDRPEALAASWLAREDDREEITRTLGAFVAVYGRWIDEALEGRREGIPAELRDAANANLERCRTAWRRMREGVAVLEQDDIAWQAFALANAAMDRQARYEAKRERKGPLTWRPFQLAYMLIVVPGLVRPESEDRNCLDLLWFPTGGGKTEAYLALTAFQIFLRRLADTGRRQHGGVDVLMRYTLRLLTVQQFQRAASLICACDAIRRERVDLGDAPISLGLYVGDEATPNRADEAAEALREERQGHEPRSTPRQLLDCPVCGHRLPATSYIAMADGSGIEIHCREPECGTGGTSIPVLTVDEHLYASPPSLIIGTIDKFAQLPRRSDLRSLFGLDGGLRPGLIIQDELHLISGPLGSMAGLYETVIDLVCTDGSVRPKLIGSTATIGQAGRQVRALFDRDVLQFPPAGIEARDSFFAVRDEKGPDRVYLGLSSAGRSPKFALQAATAALLQAAGRRRDAGARAGSLDPFWTAVLYFNSLRELGGAHVLVQDDIPRHMSFLASRMGCQRRHLEAAAIELSSRVASRQLPEYLNQLAMPLDGVDGDPFGPVPTDVVLASNMISVGVDVPRLGLMLVNGQPKSTAEYIQASSRVGRGLPGLVVTLYNFGRPRDVSHFEHFRFYHGTLYRNVEATSVTPWAPRARDKALHAVVAAAVRHLVPNMDDEKAARDFDASDVAVQTVLAAISRRAHSASSDIEGDESEADVEGIVRQWGERSRASRAAGTTLLYWERKAPFGRTKPHLMTSAEEGKKLGRTGWPTPNSMREVEPSTAFALRLARRD